MGWFICSRNVARAAQGLGASVMMALSMAMVGEAVSKEAW